MQAAFLSTLFFLTLSFILGTNCDFNVHNLLLLKQINQTNQAALQLVTNTCDQKQLNEFIGCFNKYLSYFKLTMTNNKLPDANTFMNALMKETEEFQCKAYKQLLDCKATPFCMLASTMNYLSRNQFDSEIYQQEMMAMHLSCTNIDVPSVSKCMEKVKKNDEIRKCNTGNIPDISCKSIISAIKCGKETIEKICSKKDAETICEEGIFAVRFQEALDSTCYEQLEKVCSNAPIAFDYKTIIFPIIFVVTKLFY